MTPGVYNIEQFVNKGDGVICTVGMFDGVHIGHRHILARVCEEGRRLGMEAVAVTFDRHPREVLNIAADELRLLTTQEERYEELRNSGISAIAEVHFTKEVAQLSACEFFKKYLVGMLHAKVLVLGYDNMFGNKQNNDFEKLEETAAQCGVSVMHDEAVSANGKAVSSTRIRRLLSEGDVAQAGLMLGRHYTSRGIVVRGRQVGRTIGFPTANIAIEDSRKAMPKEGVYKVEAVWDDRVMAGDRKSVV